jgi:hypothetical protein
MPAFTLAEVCCREDDAGRLGQRAMDELAAISTR